MTTPPARRFCCDEDLAFPAYGGPNAADDLARWRDGKLHGATRELIEVVLREGVAGARLLDIGAGIGAVHLSLLEAGAADAVDVDASREYLAASRAEAERRGLQDRVDYRFGDVVELAGELPPADIVTLDPRSSAATPRSRRCLPQRRDPPHGWSASRTRYFIHRRTEVARVMAAGTSPSTRAARARGARSSTADRARDDEPSIPTPS